jgi:hypothetical protein
VITQMKHCLQKTAYKNKDAAKEEGDRLAGTCFIGHAGLCATRPPCGVWHKNKKPGPSNCSHQHSSLSNLSCSL